MADKYGSTLQEDAKCEEEIVLHLKMLLHQIVWIPSIDVWGEGIKIITKKGQKRGSQWII